MNVLEISNVTKRFGNLVAVRDVSLNVAKGELCAIIGPNGAGKTTFFNLISGFFPPTSGAITFDGRDITNCTPRQALDARPLEVGFALEQLVQDEGAHFSADVKFTGQNRADGGEDFGGGASLVSGGQGR